jgi:hypothetical protein
VGIVSQRAERAARMLRTQFAQFWGCAPTELKGEP